VTHIVVAIPAMNDDDLVETLKHLFALSSRRHKLTVVVHEQVSRYGDWDVPSIVGFDSEVHAYHYIHRDDGIGCWPARRGISTYLRDEDIVGDYGLCIDSHTRFRADWDDTLVQLHGTAKVEVGSEWLGEETTDVVLSAPMHPDMWGDIWQMMPVTYYDAEWSLGEFMPLLKSVLCEPIEETFLPARHFAGCLSFGPFALLHLWQRHGDRILFSGEEHVMSQEVFRAGWGLWHCRLPLAHLALRPAGRPWDDNGWNDRHQESYLYVRKVLHADLGSCDLECAREGCIPTRYQLRVGLDYRAGRELETSPWHRAIQAVYPPPPSE